MDRRGEKVTGYVALLAIVLAIAGSAFGALVSGQQAAGEFHPFRGWNLVFSLIVFVGMAAAFWLAAGLMTPLYDLPGLSSGSSYAHQLRTLPARRKSMRVHLDGQRRAVVLQQANALEWNEVVLSLALAERKVWASYERGLNVRRFDSERLLARAPRPVWEFLSRCGDINHALADMQCLSYGVDLLQVDAERIESSLGAVIEARTLVGAAVKAVSA